MIQNFGRKKCNTCQAVHTVSDRFYLFICLFTYLFVDLFIYLLVLFYCAFTNKSELVKWTKEVCLKKSLNSTGLDFRVHFYTTSQITFFVTFF